MINTWSKEDQDKFFSLAYQVEDDVYVGMPPGDHHPKLTLKEK